MTLRKKTNDQLLTSAKRELKMRKKVYPGLVEAKKMNKADMDHEITCQTHIVRFIKRQQLVEMGMPPGNMQYGEGIIKRYTLTYGEHSVLLVYVDGLLEAIANMGGPTELRVHEGATAMKINLPATVGDIETFRGHGFNIEEIPTLSQDQKIEAFRAAYKNNTGKHYHVTQLDRNVLNKNEGVGMQIELLELYFNCTDYPLNGPKTLADYSSHYGALPEMYERNRRDPDGLPFYFDIKLYKHMEKHQPALWMKYRKKLKEMGFKEVTRPEGKTWQK